MFRSPEEDRWRLVQPPHPTQPPPRRHSSCGASACADGWAKRAAASRSNLQDCAAPRGASAALATVDAAEALMPANPGGIQSLVADKLWQDNGGSRLEMMLQMLEKSGSAAGDVRASEASERNMWRRTVGCARSRRSKRFARTSRTSELQTDSIVLIQALRAAGKWPR